MKLFLSAIKGPKLCHLGPFNFKLCLKGQHPDTFKFYYIYLVLLQVLLGESYYVDRTSKQTTEILKRRGNTLESQVESLNAVMQDLKAEASFFDATASEAAVSLNFLFTFYIMHIWRK